MKINQLSEKQARLTYYSIRERLAAAELMKLINGDITHVSDEEGSDSWDMCYNSEFDCNIAEVKLRYRKSSDFDTWIFEKRKFDTLLNMCSGPIALKINLQPKFIVFFKDIIAIWNVNDIKIEDFHEEFLRAESIGGELDKKMKMIANLKLENAITFNYQLDFDKINVHAKTIFKYKYPTTNLIF